MCDINIFIKKKNYRMMELYFNRNDSFEEYQEYIYFYNLYIKGCCKCKFKTSR